MTPADEPDTPEQVRELQEATAAHSAIYRLVQSLAETTTPSLVVASLLSAIVRTTDEYELPRRHVAAMLGATLSDVLRKTGAGGK